MSQFRYPRWAPTWMISRMKKMTSRAEAVLVSDRKSHSRCSTLAATSGKRTAHVWMACRGRQKPRVVRGRGSA